MQRVLATLAPSSRAVAQTYRGRLPPGWRTVNWQGVSLSIPPKWTVSNIDGMSIVFFCGFNAESHVTLGEAKYVGAASCPQGPGEYGLRQAGGVYIGNAKAPPSTTTTIAPDLVNNPYNTSVLPVTVGVDHGREVAITIGVGRDGRVPAEIINSIHVTHATN
jgi:hypothetical protein